MADTGWLSPDSVVSQSPGDVAWSNPGNAVSENAAYADAVITSQVSEWLVASDFDVALPPGATPDGVEFRIVKRRDTDGGDVTPESVMLLLGGVIGGTQNAERGSGENWPTSDTESLYGGAADLWDETLDEADVEANDFGVAIKATGGPGGSSATQAFVDVIQMRVYYTEAVAGGQPTMRRFGGVPGMGQGQKIGRSW